MRSVKKDSFLFILKSLSICMFVLLFAGCAAVDLPPDKEPSEAAHDIEKREPESDAEVPLFSEIPPVEEAASGEGTAAHDPIGDKIGEKIAEALERKVGEKRALSTAAPDAVAALDGGHRLRVRVIDGRKTIRVNGAKGTGNGVNVTRISSTHVRVNRKRVELPLHLTPTKKFVYLNGRPYRGSVDIYAAEVGLMAVNELFLEPYIVGLINQEISSKWPEAAVKAQAVIARTYALHQKEQNRRIGLDERFDIDGSVLGQVYKGAKGEDSLGVRAVKSTRSIVLTYNGKLALTVYHSNAGGITESSANLWVIGYPYLRSVKSEYDKGSPGYAWQYAVTPEKLAFRLKRAGFKAGRPEGLTVTERTGSGRVYKLEVTGTKETVTLSGKEFRAAIGYDFIKSTKFEASRKGNLFFFEGRGLGHGVGLSQWGAKGMAAAGATYKEILRHYYPGTKLGRIKQP